MADEENNPLLLRLILAVLERQLGNLDGREHVGVAVNLARVNAIYQVSHVVGLREAHVHPKLNQICDLPSARHAEDAHCVLGVLLGLSLTYHACGVNLSLPTTGMEVAIAVPLRVV